MRLKKKPIDPRRMWAFMIDEDESSDAGSGASASFDDDGDANISVPSTTSVESDATIDWNTLIPEDLREKDYFKNVLKAENPGAELVKQFDNVQQLIGKKTPVLPADDASDDEWEKFVATLRPKSADDYNLKMPEFGDDKKEVAELFSQIRSEDSVKAVKELAHKVGLPKKPFEKFVEAYEQMNVAQIEQTLEQQKAAQKALDDGFEEVFNKSFGADRSKAESFGRQFIKDHTPEKLKPYLEGLPNEMLALAAAWGASVHKKYEGGDSFTPGSSFGGYTVDSVTAEIHRLMRMPGYTDPFSGDHDKLVSDVRELSKKKAELLKKQ